MVGPLLSRIFLTALASVPSTFAAADLVETSSASSGVRAASARGTSTGDLQAVPRPGPTLLSNDERGSRVSLIKREFRPEEYGATIAGFVGLGALSLLAPEPPMGWKRDLPLDRPVFNLLGGHSQTQRERLSDLSDALQTAIVAFPALIDLGLVTLALKRDPELAWQMAWMDLEAFAVTASVILATKSLVGRVRPLTPPCEDDRYACASESSRSSFISGHSAAAFTAAGLICAHHTQLELFGGGLADDFTCAAALGVAATTGALRVASERHYFTDVLAGTGVGLISGWLLPWLLHYRETESSPAREAVRGRAELALLGGLLVLGPEAWSTAGMRLSVHHREELLSLLELQVSVLGGISRALHPGEPERGLRELSSSIGLAFGPMGLGFAVDYRSLLARGRSTETLLGGLELILILLDGEKPVLSRFRWLPLFSGTARAWALDVEIPLWRHLSLHAGAQTLDSRGGGLLERGALASAGLGGRLPW